MFTISLKSYEICSFILVGHHKWNPFTFYDFRSTNELNIDQCLCTVCGKKCNPQFYWINIIDNYTLCVWCALVTLPMCFVSESITTGQDWFNPNLEIFYGCRIVTRIHTWNLGHMIGKQIECALSSIRDLILVPKKNVSTRERFSAKFLTVCILIDYFLITILNLIQNRHIWQTGNSEDLFMNTKIICGYLISKIK